MVREEVKPTMVIPRTLASKIEAYGALKVLQIIQAWEKRRERDKKRYGDRRELLRSLDG